MKQESNIPIEIDDSSDDEDEMLVAQGAKAQSASVVAKEDVNRCMQNQDEINAPRSHIKDKGLTVPDGDAIPCALIEAVDSGWNSSNAKHVENVEPTTSKKGLADTGSPSSSSSSSGKTKRFQCQVCDYGTHYKNDMKRHVRTHTGEKPHHCDYCEKAFARMGSLRSHIATHKSRFPFHCLRVNLDKIHKPK